MTSLRIELQWLNELLSSHAQCHKSLRWVICIFNGVISLNDIMNDIMTFCFFGMEDMDEKVASKRIYTADNSQNIIIPNTAVQYHILLCCYFLWSVKYWRYQISCHLKNVWSAFSSCLLLLQGCSILFLEIYRPLEFNIKLNQTHNNS